MKIQRDLSLPMNAEELIPQRPPLRFVNRLLQFDGVSGLVEAVLDADSLLCDDRGIVDPLAAVELMAQSYATFKGYQDLLRGDPVKKGLLVSVRDCLITDTLLAGDRLEIMVKTFMVVSEFAIADASIRRGGRQIASATLKLFIPEDVRGDQPGR